MGTLYDDLKPPALSKVALIYEERPFSYSQFLSLIDEHAARLSGVAPGQCVPIGSLEKPDFLAALYACFKIGAVAVPTGEPDPAWRGNGSEALIIFTSGTTGARKGVILGHEGISGTAAFMNKAMGVDASIREYVFAPLDHAFGFGRAHAVLKAGGTVFLGGKTANYQWLFSALEEHACNALSVVPSVLASLIKIGGQRLKEVGKGVRWVQTGAMRLDRAYRDQLCDVFPDAKICLHYGLSEAMRTTFFDMKAQPDKRHTEGPAADGVEIGIFSPEGERLSPGKEGIIRIRGRNLAIGYTDKALWNSCFRDGWFITSDVGVLDPDGHLIFVGRSDDVIKVNGYLVHPNEIESRLEPLLRGRSCCVVGMPDDIKDHVLVLCLEGQPSVALSDIAGVFANDQSHMIPSRIVHVDHLPKTGTGKIVRKDVARIVRQSISS